MAQSHLNKLALQLRDLHVPGRPLILANVYDAATALTVASLPAAKAIATASFAVAAAEGVKDEDLTREQNVAAARKIAVVVSPRNLPVTVDIQDGYDDVQQTIRDVIGVGAVGCNLEDSNARTGTVRPLSEAVERIRLAMDAAREAGVPNFVINARTDVINKDFKGKSASVVDEAIERGKAYLAAGAWTVFVFGRPKGLGISRLEIERLVGAFEGMISVNVRINPDALSVSDLAMLGVARVSVGPQLYWFAMKAFQNAAEGLLQG